MWRCLLLAVIVAEAVQGKELSGCPVDCTCYIDSNGYQAASCHHSRFFSNRDSMIPLIKLLQIVPFHKTSLTLYPNMFIKFKSLKVLNLANCSIIQVPNDTFLGLHSIVDIDLSYNKIRYLKRNVFRMLPLLRTLILRGNPLSLTQFDRLYSESLRELDMGECQLKSIPEDAFAGVEGLTHLSLDGNYLQTISFRSLPHNLRYLNLANNKIVNAPVDDLLSRFFLKVLDLGGNPINCTCNLLVMQDWLSGKGITFENNLICHFPPPFMGRPLNRVNEDEVCSYEMEERNKREKRMNSIKYQDYMSYKKHGDNNLLSEQEVMADQPLTQDAETLFSNEYTHSLSTHMEHKSDAKDREAIEGSGDDGSITDVLESEESHHLLEGSPKSINFDDHSEEATTSKDDTSSSFEFTTSEKDLENDLKNETSIEVTEMSDIDNNHLSHPVGEFSSNKTDNEEDEGSASEPGPELEGSGILVQVSNESWPNELSTKTSSDVPITPTTDIESDLSSTEATSLVDIIITSSVEPIITSSQETSSSVYSTDKTSTSESNILFESLTTEGIIVTSPKMEIVTETFQKHTINDTLERYSDTSTEASVSNVTADGVLSADMSGIYQISTYLVVAVIALPIIVLILMAVYKRRAPGKIRLPRDNESNVGTELQDMDTLLPKNGTENGVKVVAAGPKANGAANPSDSKDPEEVIPVLEAEEQEEPPSIGAPNSTTPIQRTKAKLTVLPDSVPKTPVFIHKAYPD